MAKLLPDEKTTLETYEKVASIWANNYSPAGFWADELKKFQKLLPTGKVLEIGCGNGRDARELVALGYEYTGTDISTKLLELARNTLPDQKFYQQSVYELAFPEKFDGFWASKVLLHLPKSRIEAALQRIQSVIKPGAIGFISLIAGDGEELREEDWDDGSRHSRYFAYYTKDEFKKIIELNGFQMLDYNYWEETPRLRWHCFFVKTTDHG